MKDPMKVPAIVGSVAVAGIWTGVAVLSQVAIVPAVGLGVGIVGVCWGVVALQQYTKNKKKGKGE